MKWLSISPQFEIQASDQGTPVQRATTHVLVTIREDSAPRFENLPRQQTVSENAQNNSVVFDVRGNDEDKQVGINY